MNRWLTKLRHLLFTFTITWGMTLYVCAQVNLQKDSITKKGKLRKVFGFPAVIYSPETTLAFGAAGNFYFKLSHDSTVRTSYLQGLGLYTLRGQAVLGTEGAIYFPKEKYILKLHASASYFPDRFWGLGNNSRDQDLERYTIGQYYFYPQFLRKIYKRFFAGITYEVQSVFSFDYGGGKPAGTSLFDVQNVQGRHGSFVSGLGFIAQWDGRNNAFSPSRGFYFSYTVTDFNPSLGSNYTYTYHFLDFRRYYSVGRRENVIAFQMIGNFNDGTVPIRSMANIGSSSMMRGYYEGRYADKNLFGFQSEFRFHVIGRFGMVVFGAMGRVGSTVADAFSFEGLKPSLGTGLRYAIDKKEKLNIRLDFGVGQNSNGFYFNLIEAF